MFLAAPARSRVRSVDGAREAHGPTTFVRGLPHQSLGPGGTSPTRGRLPPIDASRSRVPRVRTRVTGWKGAIHSSPGRPRPAGDSGRPTPRQPRPPLTRGRARVVAPWNRDQSPRGEPARPLPPRAVRAGERGTGGRQHTHLPPPPRRLRRRTGKQLDALRTSGFVEAHLCGAVAATDRVGDRRQVQPLVGALGDHGREEPHGGESHPVLKQDGVHVLTPRLLRTCRSVLRLARALRDCGLRPASLRSPRPSIVVGRVRVECAYLAHSYNRVARCLASPTLFV
jgi:hypothetical protein